MTALRIESLGLVEYSKARAIQEDWRDQVLSGDAAEALFLCQHPATVTFGRRADAEALRIGADFLRERGISIHRTTRGGEVTLHSPNQIIVYPVMSLAQRRMRVREFVLTLLNCAASVARQFGIPAHALENPAGVFVENRKLAAVGLQISKGVTNHGMSFNVANDLDLFSLIVPCGRSDLPASSLAAELGKNPGIETVEMLLCEQLSSVLG